MNICILLNAERFVLLRHPVAVISSNEAQLKDASFAEMTYHRHNHIKYSHHFV